MTTLGFYSPTHQYSPVLATTPLPLLANSPTHHYWPTWFPPPQSVLLFHFFFLTSLFTHLYFFPASRRGLALVRSLVPSCPLKLTDQSFFIHFLFLFLFLFFNFFDFFSRCTVS